MTYICIYIFKKIIIKRENADKLVNGNGKLEEIIVCSNEIAVSGRLINFKVTDFKV